MTSQSPHIPAELRQTIAVGALDAPGNAASASVSANANANASASAQDVLATALPQLPREAIATRSLGASEQTHHPDGEDAPRHQVGERLGLGASGEVYAVQDRNLQRTVAVKIVPPDHAQDLQSRLQLIAEARITASLSHPNVLPVYDLDVDLQGRAYFSMKRVDGYSLGYVLEQSSSDHRHDLISTGSRIVNLFIGVAQALAYAHGHGVIHQDIKPDNIMLGQFGEILVVDWGSACRLVPGITPRLYGTPLYMSPEQARSESVDARSDVYCLGASLLQVLLLRPPTWDDDLECFWHKKRAGELDPITAVESRQAPPQLLSIAMKALSRLPSDRYQDGDALLQDLKLYQAGLPVSAHHDSFLESMVRYYRTYRRLVWTTLAVSAVVACLLGFLYTEWVKEIASWGPPVLHEDFSDDSWKQRWVSREGQFVSTPRGLESRALMGSAIICTQKFSGATAIEYECETLPGNPLGDMSVMWYPEVQFSPDRTAVLSMAKGYFLQFGAFNGACSQIDAQNAGSSTVSYNPTHPVVGRRYHVRAQIADDHLELLVDGRLLCSWTEPFSFNSGYLGLKSYYPGKVFSHLRIYSRGMAQKVVATAIGDAFVQHGDLAEAENQYARLVASYPATALGQEALFKQGLCVYREGRFDEAFALWKPLRGGTYTVALRQQDIDHLFHSGHHQAALAAIAELARTVTPAQRHLLSHQWAQLMSELVEARSDEEQKQWLLLHDQEFSQESAEDGICAATLNHLQRYQEVIDRYPQQRFATGLAHLGLGHLQILMDQFQDQFYAHDMAAYIAGRPELIDERFEPELFHTGRIYTGHPEEVVRDHPDDPQCAPIALAFLGRTDEAIRIPGMDPFLRDMILCNAGRTASLSQGMATMGALADGSSDDQVCHSGIDWCQDLCNNLRALHLWMAGDHQLALRTFHSHLWEPYHGALLLFVRFSDYSFNAFAVPFLRSLDGDPQAFLLAAREVKDGFPLKFQQRLWYQARYLLGEIDDATFLAQPWKLYAPAELQLMRALRAEHGGMHEQAKAAYAAWLALPTPTRDDFPNPVWREFVRWRLAVLGKTH